MNFDTAKFVAFCAAAVVALNVTRAQRWRGVALLLLNVIFVASFLSGVSQVLPLAVFVMLGYVAIVLSSRSGPKFLLVLVGVVVVLFMWVKQYTIMGFLPHLSFPYLLVGFSYILFRIIHLMVEVNDGAKAIPNPLAYLVYLLFFLSFVSGPIQPYDEFAHQVSAPRLPRSREAVHESFSRMILGFFLVAFVSRGTFYVFGAIEPHVYECLRDGVFGLKIIVLYSAAALAYAVHLYVNFSGYMEIVIAVGMFCGFQLPENFNRPYLARNVLEFWSRWHITLSEWFKVHVFNPTLKVMAHRWGTPARMPYLGAAAFCLTFLIMGIWHGSTKVFVVYGLFLGLGMSLNMVYRVEMGKRLGREAYKVLQANEAYQHLSRALTLAYFTIALTCLWLPPAQVRAVTTMPALGAGVAAFFLLACGLFVLGMAIAKLTAVMQRFEQSIRKAFAGVAVPAWVAPAWIGIKCYVVVNLAIIANAAPEFIYKGF